LYNIAVLLKDIQYNRLHCNRNSSAKKLFENKVICCISSFAHTVVGEIESSRPYRSPRLDFQKYKLPTLLRLHLCIFVIFGFHKKKSFIVSIINQRYFVGSLQNFMFPLGILLLVFGAYFLPDWRQLIRFFTILQIPPLIFLL